MATKVYRIDRDGYKTTLIIEDPNKESLLMAEFDGIKETKETMLALLKITALLAATFKDGIQAQDVAVVIAKISEDAALKTALLEAYNGIDKVPSEIKDLSFKEGFELVTLAVPELIDIVAKMKA